MARSNRKETVPSEFPAAVKVGEGKVRRSSEPMYFAFVVWGAALSAILCFLGYAYLTFFNREFGIEMEDFSYYEVLLKSFNVIKILSPHLLAFIVLLGSFLFTLGLVLRDERSLLMSWIHQTRGWVLLILVPALTLLFSFGLWVFFREAFLTAREAGIIYAQYLKTHLEEENQITFIFEPAAAKSLPPLLLAADAQRELRLVARTKLSYYVMRKPPEGFDPLVYEIPRTKVNLAVITH